MDPARLARSWQGRLPGAAMLALERAAHDLPFTVTVTETEPRDRNRAPGPETEAATDALARGITRRTSRARAALRDVRNALADADLTAATSHLAAARDIAAPLSDPSLDAWLDIFESELAAASGDIVTAARRSCAAESAARRAADGATFLSIFWLRAVRAFRRGNGGDADLVHRWMESWLAATSPRATLRLRCFAAAFALDDERPDHAIDLASGVVGAAPGTPEAALAGSIVAQAFLAVDRATDSARIATSSIVRCASLPPRIAARLYHDASLALDLAGAAAEATRCAELAHRLDPDIAAAPTAGDFAVVGLEVRLL